MTVVASIIFAEALSRLLTIRLMVTPSAVAPIIRFCFEQQHHRSFPASNIAQRSPCSKAGYPHLSVIGVTPVSRIDTHSKELLEAGEKRSQLCSLETTLPARLRHVGSFRTVT
jgi:hypothetical protein